MKRHAVIVAIHANHSDLEISEFLKFARLFVHKVSRVRSIWWPCRKCCQKTHKRKKHKARSDRVRTSHFVQQVQGIIDEDPSKSIKAISRDLQVSECTIYRIVHEDIRYKSYEMRKGQFMLAQTREQRFIRAQWLLNKLKHPESRICSGFILTKKILTRIKK